MAVVLLTMPRLLQHALRRGALHRESRLTGGPDLTPPCEGRFLHRDFHPGNALFEVRVASRVPSQVNWTDSSRIRLCGLS